MKSALEIAQLLIAENTPAVSVALVGKDASDANAEVGRVVLDGLYGRTPTAPATGDTSGTATPKLLAKSTAQLVEEAAAPLAAPVSAMSAELRAVVEKTQAKLAREDEEREQRRVAKKLRQVREELVELAKKATKKQGKRKKK